MKKFILGCIAAVAVLISLAGCEQEKHILSGTDYLMFSDTLYNYGVQETNAVFNVPVAATKRVDYDRNAAVEIVELKSNAVEGKHYQLLNHTVTIKAGELAANVEVKGAYENIQVGDSLGFTLRLLVPENEQWEMYGNETKVLLHKVCPFDLNKFTGYCTVRSSFFGGSDIPNQNTSMRLIKSEIVPGKENTVALNGIYYDGYKTEISFDLKDPMEPLIDMETQVGGSTAEAFGTTYGNGKLMFSPATQYTSYFSSCEKFVYQFIIVHVENKDGSSFGTVGVFLNLIEWISDAEAEKLKEQGY